jgi:nicotinamidase-related amidase
MSPGISKDFISDFSVDIELDPNSTALVVVDMQYASACRETGLGRILREQGKHELAEYRFNRIESIVIPTIKRLLSFFRENHLAVIYLTMGSATADYSDILPVLRNFVRSCNNKAGEMEHDILQEVRAEPGEIVINKTTLNAFNSTNMGAILFTRNVRYLCFTGVSTNMCVESTAREAAERGFICVLVEDGCGATKPEYHESTMVTFQRLLGKVRSSEEVVEELKSKICRR